MKKIIASLFLILIALSSTSPFFYVWADDGEDDNSEEIEELENEISKLEKKVSETQDTIKTLSGEIAYMDNQIALTEAKIKVSLSNIYKTQEQIAKLEVDIDDLKNRIEHLGDSISYQRTLLNNRSRERYKSQETSPIMVLFGTDTLGKLIRKSEYLKLIEIQDNKLLDEMERTKKSYDTQKDLYEKKRQEEVDLKEKLEKEKAGLDANKARLNDQKEDKKDLLSSTQNDEAKYQELLQKAQDELASYKGFVQYAGGGVVSSGKFGSGKEGWYYSQRDSRWAYNKIGKSKETIFEVGCLLTSVAMLYKKYGESATPATIAADSKRFWYNTAMMTIPWKGPGGRTYTSISRANISSEISKNPVIVGVYAGSYGTHFVVLAKKSGSDYIMYDPYYGPDLKFSDYYSFNSIFQAVVFK